METKELKIKAPKGYEIDKENSTFECIKFKPIQKYITYEDVCNTIFVNDNHPYFISDRGHIRKGLLPDWDDTILPERHVATNKKQLKKLLALNQLLNIAEYYNKVHSDNTNPYTIVYCKQTKKYNPTFTDNVYTYGMSAFFNSEEDAQAVIDNPNFREILDTIYKN